jgi:hypothetical protein
MEAANPGELARSDMHNYFVKDLKDAANMIFTKLQQTTKSHQSTEIVEKFQRVQFQMQELYIRYSRIRDDLANQIRQKSAEISEMIRIYQTELVERELQKQYYLN